MGYWVLAIGRWQMANNMMIISPVKCTVLPRNTRIRKVLTTAEVSNNPQIVVSITDEGIGSLLPCRCSAC